MYFRVFLGNLRHQIPVVLMALALGLGFTLMFLTLIILQQTRSHFLETIGFIPHIRVYFNNAMNDESRESIFTFINNIREIHRSNFGYITEKTFEINWYDEIGKRWHKSIKRNIILIGLSIPKPMPKEIMILKEDNNRMESVNGICTSFRPNSIRVEISKSIFNKMSGGRWWLNPREVLHPQGNLKLWEKGQRLPYFFQKSEGCPIKNDGVSIFLPLDTEEMEQNKRKKIEGLATSLTVKMLAPCFASDVFTVLNQKAREKLDYLVYGPIYSSIVKEYPFLFMSDSLFEDVFHDKFVFKKVQLNGHNQTIKGECVATFDYFPSKNFNQNLILFNIRDLWKQMSLPDGYYNILDIKLKDVDHLNMVKRSLVTFLNEEKVDRARYKIIIWRDIVGKRLTILEHISSTGKALLSFMYVLILVVLISLSLYYYKLIAFKYELLKAWGMQRWMPAFIILLPVSIIGWLIFSIACFISINSLNRVLEVNYYQIVAWPTNLYIASFFALILTSAISTIIASMIYRLYIRSNKDDLF